MVAIGGGCRREGCTSGIAHNQREMDLSSVGRDGFGARVRKIHGGYFNMSVVIGVVESAIHGESGLQDDALGGDLGGACSAVCGGAAPC